MIKGGGGKSISNERKSRPTRSARDRGARSPIYSKEISFFTSGFLAADTNSLF